MQLQTLLAASIICQLPGLDIYIADSWNYSFIHYRNVK